MAPALFGIVQESLTTVARHAGATQVKVSLTTDELNLLLPVSESGAGIVADALTGIGIGLVSMRERAAALGGKFNIAGVPGAGTTIEVTLPLTLPLLRRKQYEDRSPGRRETTPSSRDGIKKILADT